MTLIRYKQKRNFKSTSEPEGKLKKTEHRLVFVIHKHDAKQLHYDLRLEMDGMLKSWAVPKGPSMNPEDKRLAIMVEDHPCDYKDFEGNIPKGNYGAGSVIIWDNGYYTAVDVKNTAVKKNDNEEKKLKAGLHKGHISFILEGEKLKGAFDLVKIHDSKENAWLLIKKNDKYSSKSDILKKAKSVVSSSTIESLNKKSEDAIPEKKKNKVINSDTAEDIKRPPEFMKPMLAELTTRVFDDKDWIFEVKFDGYRTVAVIDRKQVDLFSRNQLSFNEKFKPIQQELRGLNHSAVLDGEVVIEDGSGRSDFQLLQNYQKTGKGNLRYYVFDILNLDGNDTTKLTLLERKELVKLLIDKKFKNILYSGHISQEGKAFFEEAVKNNFEGIIAKAAESPYRTGTRSREWLKIKITREEEAVIAGITEPRGSRQFFGSILLAQYKGRELIYIGNCGTGFNEDALKELYKKFKPLFRTTSPVAGKVITREKIQWIEPKYVCQVKFTERTQDGSLRHPVYLGLRVDKTAKEVTMPDPEKIIEIHDIKKEEMRTDEVKTDVGKSDDFDLKVGKITLHLTNQNKIYFPDDGITKGDIVNYYSEISEVMLPYLRNRPQSLNRFPNGINGASFFQKDFDVKKIPSWLKTTRVMSESSDDYIDYLLCNDKATLLYMANLGCIEINPWNSTIKNPVYPDWMVIDLDPVKVEFSKIAETAAEIRKILESIEVESYCKTSGSKGLHIYIPLAARYDYDTVKIFAKFIATALHQQIPVITSIERAVSKRQNKIYLDYLQNNRSQTLAAPYSVRPRPGATVSAPLEWSEVNSRLSLDQFTIRTMMSRIDKKGDLWQPVLGKGVNLNKLIKRLQE